MKQRYKTLFYSSLFTLALGVTSCEDYLDKDPDTTVDAAAAFQNFNNFQGFVEEIYNCIPDKTNCYWTTSFNWGDDEIMNTNADWHMTHQVDLGNFWAWQAGGMGEDGCWLDAKRDCDPTSNDRMNHRLWPHAWYCIRKCNLGLANLDQMVGATQEERDLIAGQLYFFRAWWHFELMEYLGGLPYIDQVLESEGLTLPRLSFQEAADKAAADFRQAANLLPIDWESTTAGSHTAGQNDLRINKIMALGYLGKTYLWAGSPLMEHGAQTGGAMTYSYNTDYCQKAAEAFGELLNLVESGQTQYALAQFEYDDIYNHERSATATSCFSDIFYTTGQNWELPGSVEAIFRGPAFGINISPYQAAKTYGPKGGIVPDDNIIHMPTANYVNLYGMANGYPLDDPRSGFDPTHPFRDRDPRFYHDIVFDGFEYINASVGADMAQYKYSQLYTDGNVRNDNTGSRTGYFIQKLSPHTVNTYDKMMDYNHSLQMYVPYMRLGDIYLMYAEACAAINGATGKAGNCSLTAEDAINRLRDRVHMDHVPADLTSNKETFMDEVRRERAVELSFEGFRFCDLQRWLLLTEYPYNVKTSQEFERVESDEWYTENDPRDAEVRKWREEVILTRNFTSKHYWFPLKNDDTYLYEGLNQNPGW
ncbi:RagB/SusD family nutrient uptake outer membrane protein [Bacteroides gallinaceum]|uniref:RagB/SusD family nutrient uptake outer membrane protein n=1 Tax=Bacteroides gallinaceum TaxID=1462571 RepID=UPI0025A3B194|nr:RagB/SusD family nutrient uptake outer membrane protein [Bacteroides gallinaceum]MDM8153837.1 RagB/SusD family nutrient uptake outer membrane protein [Bacteroides gallinaceum]